MSIHQFPGRDPPLTAVTWGHRLDAASSVREVVDVARDYIATFEPHEIYRLPPQCRPGKFFDANDIAGYSNELVRSPPTDDPVVDALQAKLLAFFSQASMRATEILTGASDFENERSA